MFDADVVASDTSSGWRLLVFDAGAYIGATNHRSLQAAKRVAEQWESAPALWGHRTIEVPVNERRGGHDHHPNPNELVDPGLAAQRRGWELAAHV